jgi:hypothetical protein
LVSALLFVFSKLPPRLMFHVKDNREARSTRIRAFLTKRDAGIAVVLAATHFEWTVGRAILFLGRGGTAELRKEVRDCRGLDGYKGQWNKRLGNPHLPQLIKQWSSLRKAFDCRNTLVHGIRPIGLPFARAQVEIILRAADQLLDYCQNRDANLFTRLRPRRKKMSLSSAAIVLATA